VEKEKKFRVVIVLKRVRSRRKEVREGWLRRRE